MSETSELSKEDQKYVEFQTAILEATKDAITKHAPGMLLAYLHKHMRMIGGDVLVLGKDTIGVPNTNPFRIRVQIRKESRFAKDGKGYQVHFVKRVIGWG